MFVFRLSRKKYANMLSGKGAALSGNRWNSKGVEMVYCANSRALAMAEVAVHLNLALLPKDYVMLKIEIPKSISIEKLDECKLPDDWDSFPHLQFTQKTGNTFIHKNNVCVLQVPSAVVPGDYNFLVNPHHQNFEQIKIVETYNFSFDKRFLK